VNGRYLLADSPKERIAIAVVAALHSYFKQHPKGVAPGQHFLADFLEPFIEREMVGRALEELHRDHAGRELELVKKVQELIELCAKRIF